jgi:predicted TIM-barrel fold metal-dependent hydrolase
MTDRIPFFDPHFHIWDVKAAHDLDTLGKPARVHPTYLLDDYERDVEDYAPWLRLVGGCIVEALPAHDDTLAELTWIREQLSKYVKSHKSQGKQYKLYCTVGRINLTNDSASAILGRMGLVEGLSSDSGCTGVAGVRQILNFEPSWPYVSKNLLTDQSFLDAFAEIGHHVKVFDLHVNPHQLNDATQRLVARFSDTTFVLNHMGCFRCAADDFEVWCNDLASLAAFPNAFVKLSGFEYPDCENWASNPILRKMFQLLISLFGSSRCMIATNFPVTSTCGAPPPQLFSFLKELVHDIPTEAVNDLFWRTALRVYCQRTELPTLGS